MLLAILAPVLLSAPAAHAQAGAEVVRGYRVAITVGKDGSMLVTERIDYDFGSAKRHGIFRDIPVRVPLDDRYDRVYPVDGVSVTATPAGTPAGFKLENAGELLRIVIGDPNKTVTGRHVYTIQYRVRGALNGFRDHEELYWNAIGPYWDVPIESAVVVVRAPAPVQAEACFRGPLRSILPCSSMSFSLDVARFRERALQPREGVTVVVSLATGSAAVGPIRQERWAIQRAFSVTPVTGGLAGAVLLLLLVAMGRLFWVSGRDRRAAGSPVDAAFPRPAGEGGDPQGERPVPLLERGATPVEFAPPEDIRPGQVGTLVDEVAGPLDVTATIVDLAVRGYLRIEEIPRRHPWGQPDWRLVKLKQPDDVLLTYERKLVNALFETPEAEEEGADGAAQSTAQAERGLVTVRLSSLRRHFASRLRRVEDALYEDAVDRRWFAGRPDRVRGTWAKWGWLLFVSGAGLTGLAAARSHLGLLPAPVALAGLVLAWGSRWMPRRTPKGTGLVRRVLGFRTYIDTALKQEARFDEREDIFSRYLPYAVVFGLTEKWARAFGDLGDRQPAVGAWYVGPHPFTMGSLASSIDHFSVATTGSIASSPGASGSSGFGGGFSGGGGGGGGGGSW